jgi:hypothetical protein
MNELLKMSKNEGANGEQDEDYADHHDEKAMFCRPFANDASRE